LITGKENWPFHYNIMYVCIYYFARWHGGADRSLSLLKRP
jgi:hypothetical protein